MEDQLRRIRRTLQAHDLHLCRMGDRDEWVALGLRGSPTLRYQGRWECSDETLETLVRQALGETHDHRHPSKDHHRRTA